MTAHSPRHSVSVAAAVVNDEGKVLAIKRRDNEKWEPPGGVLELPEPILDGLVREVWEEAGLHVHPRRLSGVYKNVERGIVALVFHCDPGSGQLTPSAEACDLQWLTPDQVSEHMDEAYAIRLLDAFEWGTPPIRSHDGVHLVPEGFLPGEKGGIEGPQASNLRRDPRQ